MDIFEEVKKANEYYLNNTIYDQKRVKKIISDLLIVSREYQKNDNTTKMKPILMELYKLKRKFIVILNIR